MELDESNIFTLKDKIIETTDVVTLKFIQNNGESLLFRSGQFVIVSFLDNSFNKGKAYTITSLSKDKFLSLTIKRLGEFSNALSDLKIGEKVKIIGPFGNFYPTEKMNDIVFLAGGIGVTPFYSIIKSFVNENVISKKIVLFYSNKTENDIVFLRDFNELPKKSFDLQIIYALTRTKSELDFVKEYKRIDATMIKRYLRELKSRYYFICGPVQFVNDLWKILKKLGVNEDHIKTEAFY